MNLRPVLLLNIKSKGLEKLVVKKLAYTAVKRKLIPPGYVNALPGVLVIDLVYVLVYLA